MKCYAEINSIAPGMISSLSRLRVQNERRFCFRYVRISRDIEWQQSLSSLLLPLLHELEVTFFFIAKFLLQYPYKQTYTNRLRHEKRRAKLKDE
jgi:hypothetical protein